MKPFKDSTFVSGIGIVDAIERDPARLYNHYFRKYGTTDSAETASMQVSSVLSSDTLSIHVCVTNEKAGHNLPTGVSLRNIILVLKIDNEGEIYQQVLGDTLPHFAGIGAIEDGNYSGLPGKAFALVTYNATRNEWPSGNWAATGIHSDTRIPAGATDTSSYKLLINPAKGLSVKTELLYRAVYKHWANAKSWNTREYVMADTLLNIIPTGISETLKQPQSFSLKQNYPNPFNPQTVIEYSLPVTTEVNLAVFDITGREIKTLVSQKQAAGQYSIQFNALNLTSAIYICRLSTSSGFRQSRKMILLK